MPLAVMPSGSSSDTVAGVRPRDHRCLIVDDSPTFCAAVQRTLEAGGMTVVGTAATLATALAAAAMRERAFLRSGERAKRGMGVRPYLARRVRVQSARFFG